MRVAQATWGTPPCGQPHVEISTPDNYMLEHEGITIDGQSLAWADEKRCVIVINPTWKIYTATKRCHVIVHEWGHLAGRGHSGNPRSVMYPSAEVSEDLDFHTNRRVAYGAFKPCYAATRSKCPSY